MFSGLWLAILRRWRPEVGNVRIPESSSSAKPVLDPMYPSNSVFESIGSAELNAYIQRLAIPDPYFYKDVFTEDEIYSLFTPAETEPVPFYYWTNKYVEGALAGCASLMNAPDGQNTGESAWRNFLYGHPWRVTQPGDAVLHYVPSFRASKARRQCPAYNHEKLAEFYDEIYKSPEFQKLNGMNFFSSQSYWSEETHDVKYARHLFRFPKPEPRSLTGHFNNKFLMSISKTPILTGVHPTTCTVSSSFMPNPRFQASLEWPHGWLGSYRYPGGMWTHMKQHRRYNFVFYGQADRRRAYASRRTFIKYVGDLLPPSFVVQYERHRGDCKKSKLPICGNITREEQESRGCCMANTAHSLYVNAMMQGRLGVHMRGDNWGSSRLTDIIAAGMIPVIIMKQAYTTNVWNTCNVPWREIAYFIDYNDFMEDPKKSLAAILEDLQDDAKMEKRLRLLSYYRLKLMMDMASSDTMDDIMRQLARDCVPESGLRGMYNRSKTISKCPFGETHWLSKWPSMYDGDYLPPWGEQSVAFALTEHNFTSLNFTELV